jgi:hypothetical protein
VSVFSGHNWGKVVARTKRVAGMADLLECLIQIKGLGDTPRRLVQRAAEFAASPSSQAEAPAGVVEVARRLLAAETQFRRALSLMLTRDESALDLLPGDATADGAQPGELPGDSFDVCQRAFAAQRAETLRVLDACSGDQLNRTGIDPLRGPITVADLVAAMLAHDTDRLGDLVVR